MRQQVALCMEQQGYVCRHSTLTQFLASNPCRDSCFVTYWSASKSCYHCTEILPSLETPLKLINFLVD